MKKENFKAKIECMIFILLVFCMGQVFPAECGDVNSSGDVDIVDALVIAQAYVGLNPANYDSSVANVNGDSSIDIVDALLVAQYYVGLNPQNFNAGNADTNCDDYIDIVDALLIAQYYVGLITQFC